MRNLGAARTIDQLGRIVVPSEMRRDLGIGHGDLLSFAILGDTLVLTPVKNRCALCGSDGDGSLISIHDRHVCKPCMDDLAAR